MRCKRVEKLLYLYWDNELNEKQRKDIQEHIRVCQKCSEKFAHLNLLQTEAKKIQTPQLPRDYWDSFALRVKEKIEKRRKTSLGQIFFYFFKTVLTYSPTKIKWATAVVSVVLVFVVVRLFISYEKMDISIQPGIEVQRVSSPKEAPKTEAQTLDQEGEAKKSEKSGVISEKEVPKTVEIPPHDIRPAAEKSAVPADFSAGTAAVREESVQKEKAAGGKLALSDNEKFSNAIPETLPKLRGEKKGYLAVEEIPAISISDTPLVTLAEETQMQTDMGPARKDILTQEEAVRKFIDAWRASIKEKPKGQERDKAYLKIAQGYLRLYDITENRDETLKEAIDSLQTYRDSTAFLAYRDSIDHILLQLQSLYNK